MAKKPLEIDMIAGSQLMDTQGEILSIEGADISDLERGLGRINDNHKSGFFNSIGVVTGAKKIFCKEDCTDDRQLHYWNKVKAPYIYVKAKLFDDEDHPNARAAAAVLRHIHKADVPLKLKASVEGGVLQRDPRNPSMLARTKIHSVALTLTPANNATLVEPISLDKSDIDEGADMALINSVMHLAKSDIPSFRSITRDASATTVRNNLIKIMNLLGNNLNIDISSISVPSKDEIINKSIESKIYGNISKINELVAQYKEELEKNSIKNAALSAAMAAGLASTPPTPKQSAPKTEIAATKTQPATTQTSIKQKTPDFNAHRATFEAVSKHYPLLGAIAQVESSGGKNYAHKTINKKGSIHHGHTAGGMFGMMPNSAATVLRNNKDLASKYPDLAEAAKDINKNHRLFTETFNSDPKVAADFAIAKLKHNKKRVKDDNMLIYSWLNGVKGAWDKYHNDGKEGIQDHPYVQKVLKQYKPQKEEIKKSEDDGISFDDLSNEINTLCKAIAAGYGGAGTPTASVGGAVLQCESLDMGSNGKFKYISCDNCGDEQVYGKFQTKCRSCHSAFPLEKLYRTWKKQ